MSSLKIKTLEPEYFKEFKCIGDECPDHCCQTWGVSVNKQAYKNLRKHKDPVVKNFARQHFKLVDEAVDGHWAIIEMDAEGKCPALDSNGLCGMQNRVGHDKLPYTCQEYPRQAKFFGDRIEMSLVMSCPSAAENILYNYSAMMFEEQERRTSDIMHGKAGGLTPENMPSWLPVVRDYCFELAVDQSSSINERLFAIGMFLKQVTPRLGDIESVYGLVDSYREIQTDRKTQDMFARLQSAENVKWHVFAELDRHLRIYARTVGDQANAPLSSSSHRFQQCREQILWLMQKEEDRSEVLTDQGLLDFGGNEIVGSSDEFVKILKQAETTYLDAYFNENPQILTNYILYYLYNYQLYAANDRTPFEFYKIMVVDYFMLKSYLSGISITCEGIQKEWVIKLFQSYSRRRQHSLDFLDRLEDQLTESGVNSAGAIFSLLK